MCGILGIVAPPGMRPEIDETTLRAMRDRMTSRGPDAAGLEVTRNVAFGHRRLAIRDLQQGLQPWYSADRRALLVYNGEIYNDAELRRELQQYGHLFRTRCDTEVVMAAWQQWGADCVDRLNGMFAFGVYDFDEESLFLARDRFGVKPLYLMDIGACLAFASSPQALLRHPRVSAQPNFRVISHYLTTLRLTLGRETLFKGIWQLQPGETLTWQNGQVRVERYWRYPVHEEETCDDEEATERLGKHLRRAVRMRLASDVPVGLFLSGGVDSNTIACLIHEATRDAPRTYCGGGPGDRNGDFAHARACAELVDSELSDVRVSSESYLEGWDELIDENGLPLATPSDVIIYRMAQAAKPSSGVVLGGEGADELLCGYNVAHWAGYDYDAARAIADGRWRGSCVASRLFCDSYERQYHGTVFRTPVDQYFALNSLVRSENKKSLLRGRIWEAAERDEAMWHYYRSEYAQYAGLPTARQHQIMLHHINLESLLTRLDSSTMAASLEARVPFTDHRLVETMFQVPFTTKIRVDPAEPTPHLASLALQRRRSLQSKRPLRQFARTLMPASLAERPKESFPTPVVHWIGQDWSEHVRETLGTSEFGRELFQEDAIAGMTENPSAAGMNLWPLLNLVKWGERQFAA